MKKRLVVILLVFLALIWVTAPVFSQIGERAVRALLPREAPLLSRGRRALLDADPGRLHPHDHITSLGAPRDGEDRRDGLHGARGGRPGWRIRRSARIRFIVVRRPGLRFECLCRTGETRLRDLIRELPRDRPRGSRRRVESRLWAGLSVAAQRAGRAGRAVPRQPDREPRSPRSHSGMDGAEILVARSRPLVVALDADARLARRLQGLRRRFSRRRGIRSAGRLPRGLLRWRIHLPSLGADH